MTYIHQQEEKLFKEWQKRARALNNSDEIAQDGLLFRGEIYFEDGCWHRMPGDEASRWEQAGRRLLILTKDLNDEYPWDIRQETGRKNETPFSYEEAMVFYKRIRLWSYGLLNTSSANYPPFDEAFDMEIAGPFYENAPIAHVNCKKQPGGASISESTLLKYINDYSDLLRKQIELYDANIILCCGLSGGKDPIFDFISEQYLNDLISVIDDKARVYYSPSKDKIVISYHHPSGYFAYDDTYEDIMSAFSSAIERISKKYDTKLKQ